LAWHGTARPAIYGRHSLVAEEDFFFEVPIIKGHGKGREPRRRDFEKEKLCPAYDVLRDVPMPIRPDLRHFYGTIWKEEVRPKILARAGGRCEACGARGGSLALNRHGWTWRVVLTVAHVNHLSGDDRDDNLRCWCARCHLVYDNGYHRLTRSLRKDASRPLLDGSSLAPVGELAGEEVDNTMTGRVAINRVVNAAKLQRVLPLRPHNLNFILTAVPQLPLLEALM
jgi:hypothetical protein